LQALQTTVMIAICGKSQQRQKATDPNKDEDRTKEGPIFF